MVLERELLSHRGKPGRQNFVSCSLMRNLSAFSCDFIYLVSQPTGWFFKVWIINCMYFIITFLLFLLWLAIMYERVFKNHTHPWKLLISIKSKNWLRNMLKKSFINIRHTIQPGLVRDGLIGLIWPRSWPAGIFDPNSGH